MQIKKEDIEQTILMCARDEFVLHGYEDASMRTIAKKANTSLGNIYHYFPNKKAILDHLLQPIVKQVKKDLEEHVSWEYSIADLEAIDSILENTDFESVGMKALLSKEFVIFIETKDPEYSALRDEMIATFEKHIAWHMHMKDSNHHFVRIVTKMLIDCVVHLSKCDECVKNKKQDLIDMFKIMCRSVAFDHDENDQESPHPRGSE